MNEKNNSQESGNFNHGSSSFSNDEKKESLNKAGQVAARGAADYFTGGAYEKVRSAPIAGDVLEGAEKAAGKVAGSVANVASLGTAKNVTHKLDEAGAIDAANKAMGIMGAKNASKTTTTTDSMNRNVYRNTNPNPEAFSHSSSLESDTLKEGKKGGFLSSLKTNDKKDKPTDAGIGTEIVDDETPIDTDVKESMDSKIGIGCALLALPIFIIGFVVVIVAGALPVSDVMSQTECIAIDGSDCEEEESTTFLNKFKNFVKYGSFGSNSEVISKKVTEMYEKIYNEYNFIIDMPLLIATITVDLDEDLNTIDKKNEIKVSDEMLKRLDYLEELALMQMVEGNTIYQCNSKEVDGEIKYFETVYYGDTTDINVTAGTCNAYNVGKYLNKVEAKYSEEEYFKNLEENVILKGLYPNYGDDASTIISKIKMQYDLYKILYDKDEEEGNLPLYLMSDPNVNLTVPLKGRITITSLFGNRTGAFAGFHNGIDVISGDTTIYAAGDGVVTRANYESTGGYVIEITHTDSEGKKYISLYGHIKEGSFLVSVGSTVKAGDPIATMGATGVASGVHLHFSFWDASTNRDYMNPKNLFQGATNY